MVGVSCSSQDKRTIFPSSPGVQIMSYFFRVAIALTLLLISLSASAVETCRLVPEQKVRFKNTSDILFPRVDAEKSKNEDFVVEQFIKTETRYRERMYVVRDAAGGLHLASGDSMISGFAQRGMQFLSERFCPAGQADAINTLVGNYEKWKRDRIFEAMHQMSKHNSLSEDKVLCETAGEERLSLSDKVFAAMSNREAAMAPRRPEDNSYGLGFPTMGLTRKFGLNKNTFKLLGQVVNKADAPKGFQNIAYRPGESRRWQLAEAGMYLVQDEQSRIHAVRPDELSPASLNKLKSSMFSCDGRDPLDDAKDAGGKIIHPNDLPDEKPVTTEH